jgi:hypothetical protein
VLLNKSADGEVSRRRFQVVFVDADVRELFGVVGGDTDGNSSKYRNR